MKGRGRREEDKGRGNPTLDSWKLGELQTHDCLLSHKVKGFKDVTHSQVWLTLKRIS